MPAVAEKTLYQKMLCSASKVLVNSLLMLVMLLSVKNAIIRRLSSYMWLNRKLQAEEIAKVVRSAGCAILAHLQKTFCLFFRKHLINISAKLADYFIHTMNQTFVKK